MIVSMSKTTVTEKTAPPAAPAAGASGMRHRFNRFEIKYLVPEAQIPVLRAALMCRMETNPMAPAGGYRVESLYFDSTDLRFYREKIEGLKFRRKLRIRRYGTGLCGPNDPVTVEIKQRVNKVTQKRRFELGCADALSLCDYTGESTGRRANLEELAAQLPDHQLPLLGEIAAMVENLQLRPVVTTTYLREAFAGTDVEDGVRVTFDHHVAGRDKDFRFGQDLPNRPTIAPDQVIVEVKCDERVPLWLTDLTARLNMPVVRISKYCASVQAFGTQPSSIFGPVDPIFALPQK